MMRLTYQSYDSPRRVQEHKGTPAVLAVLARCSCHRPTHRWRWQWAGLGLSTAGSVNTSRSISQPWSLPLEHVCTHAHTHTHACTRTHARKHTHTRTHARTHAHTHAHTRTHARTHTYTHTHTLMTLSQLAFLQESDPKFPMAKLPL